MFRVTEHALSQFPERIHALLEPLRDSGQARSALGLRKQTPEPVFGIIKSVLGFRQFLLRGHDNVCGEWNLVTMAWNLKRMFALAGTA